MGAIALYNAFFHCSRAVLWKEGIRERSHYCIARFLETVPKLKEIFLDAFETIMSIRHTAQYATEQITIGEDLEELAHICEAYIKEVKQLIQNKP